MSEQTHDSSFETQHYHRLTREILQSLSLFSKDSFESDLHTLHKLSTVSKASHARPTLQALRISEQPHP